MKHVAIIGAGFSGAYLAYQLKHHYRVTVFEKSRGVGGRMSTRYHEQFEFDHGVPSFKAIDPEFLHFLKKFENERIIQEWNGEYIAVPRMNQWVKVLLDKVELRSSTLVQKVDLIKGLWNLEDEYQKNLGAYDILLSTAPPLQTATLLPDFAGELKKRILKPCYVLMLGINGRYGFPTHPQLDGVEKIIFNSSKPQRPHGTSIVIYMNAKWSEQYLEMDLKTLEALIVHKVLKILKIKKQDLGYQSLHRWRYATGDQNAKIIASYWDEKKQCGACGDWCFRGDVESGFLAAQMLLKYVEDND